MKLPDFFHIGTNSQRLKVDRKFFGHAWSKIKCSKSGHGLED